MLLGLVLRLELRLRVRELRELQARREPRELQALRVQLVPLERLEVRER